MDSNIHCLNCNSLYPEHICTSEDGVKLFCTNCFDKHKRIHSIPSLDISTTHSIQDSVSNKTINSPLHQDLESYSHNLKEFKHSILTTRDKIIRTVYAKADKAIQKVDKLLEDIHNKYTLMQTHMNTPNELGTILLQSYQDEGLKGILKLPKYIQINYKSVTSAIRQLFHISNRDIKVTCSSSSEIDSLKQSLTDRDSEFLTLLQKYSSQSDSNRSLKNALKAQKKRFSISALSSTKLLSNGLQRLFDSPDQGTVITRSYHYQQHGIKRYIYLPKDNSFSLVQFDISNRSVSTYDLSSILTCRFNLTSICVLSNGDIFLAGGYTANVYLPHSYIYRITFKNCIKLADMNIPRSSLGLLHYKNHIYGIGGFNSSALKTIERYEVYDDNWQVCNEMLNSRSNPACIGYRNQIFILGGQSSSVEVFNVVSFEIKEFNCRVKCKEVVVGCRDKNIYVVSVDKVYVLDQKLNLVRKHNNLREIEVCAGSNVVVDEEGLVYYNRKIMNLEKVWKELGRRDIIYI